MLRPTKRGGTAPPAGRVPASSRTGAAGGGRGGSGWASAAAGGTSRTSAKAAERARRSDAAPVREWTRRTIGSSWGGPAGQGGGTPSRVHLRGVRRHAPARRLHTTRVGVVAHLSRWVRDHTLVALGSANA